ncbi:MAG: PKD domain-containing protein [Candidatus Daviesbacteria bacterium]|nr:PKD domain-containing protein [Candidatus Daviesbacteria bacterium]
MVTITLNGVANKGVPAPNMTLKIFVNNNLVKQEIFLGVVLGQTKSLTTVFDVVGTHTAHGIMTLSNELGSKDYGTGIASFTISAPPPPITPLEAYLTVNPSSGDAPLVVDIVGSASGGVPPYSYTINPGDGNLFNWASINYGYDAGTYTITLRVIDSVGNMALTSETVYSIELPPTPPPDTCYTSNEILFMALDAGIPVPSGTTVASLAAALGVTWCGY